MQMDLSQLLQALVLQEFKLWDCLRNGCSTEAAEEISMRIAEIKMDIKNATSFSVSGTETFS
jgi:hypothetical protein